MGILTDVFVASPEEARSAELAADGPAGAYPTLQSKGLTQVELGSLQQLLAGRDVAASVEDTLDSFEDVRTEDDEGPWVFGIGDELVDGLASSTDESRARVAADWIDTEELRGQVDHETATALLDELAALARQARAGGKRLYVWMCL